MFVRSKKVGNWTYLQIVENRREDGKVRQRVVASLGRLDRLRESGDLDSLIRSAVRFSESVLVVSAHRKGKAVEVSNRRIGAGLVFERLWKELGCKEVIGALQSPRYFQFSLERAVFLTVLHRLFSPGSDRAAEKWKEAYALEGCADLALHQLYRAMDWLGEELPAAKQAAHTRYSPRCVKDEVEERLFARRRDLFTKLDLVFFDTTSLRFDGRGGRELGRWGHSKDKRPECRQMIVGVVLDGEGVPVCCEMWPGNTTDAKVLVPLAMRLQRRFGIENVCVVADRGMVSEEVLEEIEAMGWGYIVGARLRTVKEVRDQVLSHPGRYREVIPARSKGKDPAPLKVKEVRIEERRYVLCLNEDEKQGDAESRQAIVESLRRKLEGSDKALVGNKGYRRFLKKRKGGFQIDEEKMEAEARFDGKWVLRTNLELQTCETALKYKQLWMVEEMIRSLKSVLRTRPVYHQSDSAIRGHVFCSFLALMLRKELQQRLDEAGRNVEWDDLIRDLDRLEEIEIEADSRRFMLRTQTKGVAGIVCQTAGVALPPTVRRLGEEKAP